jgi:hypothetical protein
MKTSQDFTNAIHTSFHGAEIQKMHYLDINAGHLHRLVGDYPGPDQRMPLCCGAMRKEMAAGDLITDEPQKRDGASFTVRYRLPRR